MYQSDFGGHPILQHYDFSMYQRRQAEILRQAEYDRLAWEAQHQLPKQWTFQREFAHWLGMHMVVWGQKLEHFGTLQGARSLQ